MQGLFEAALARKLDRVSAAYAVAGWLLVQGASIVLPAFDAPGWTLRAFIVAVVLGFPVALTVAWFAKPLGQSANPSPLEISHREVVLLALLGAVLLLSLGELAFVILRAPQPSVAQAPPQASIAVLAFNNMSDDPKNEYFSDGISEELLNDLAQVQGLRVAGRTSSFSFKGKNATIAAIGAALNVRTVLEGSVQRVGDRVRITAQLIDAADDFHIWSQTYDREISDIFAVEDEIAHTITHELTGRLLPGKTSSDTESLKPKINPDAYIAYLQGRFFVNKRSAPDMARAVDFFKRAIALAPDYADAHASLGRTYATLYGNGQRRDTLQAAKDETATALRLDPGNAIATLNNAWIADASLKLLEAYSGYRAALARNPGDSETLHFWSNFLWRLNLPEAALAAERRAAEIDPLAPIIRESEGDDLHFLNRNADAAVAYESALTIDPGFEFALAGLCEADADIGKFAEATQILNERLVAADGADGSDTVGCKLIIAVREGDRREAMQLAAQIAQNYARGDMTASSVAAGYVVAGDVSSALRWFDKAYDARDPQLFTNITDPNVAARMKDDPRWAAFLQRPMLKEWQAAHDRIAAALAASK
jgi:adenylate cyclase